MAVNFSKKPHILVIHGVQTGDDSDITCDQQIKTLVDKSLSGIDKQTDYKVSGFLYENINDEAQTFYQYFIKAISGGNPLVGKALDIVVDTVGDVVTAANDTSTAGKIRKKLREQILKSYRSGNQLIIVAHSLGTIYALDVICELMASSYYFKGDDITTWPVQGYVSMGSPLGLDLNILGLPVFAKRNIETLSAAASIFPWHNYYNRLDPVVSGNVFGKPINVDGSKGPVEKRYGDDAMMAKWLLQGHAVTSGNQWVFAHTAYWRNPKIGDQLFNMLWD
jgi:hypothetical protein